MIVEAVVMGASGRIAGLVNALPEESVRVFDLAKADATCALYGWFLPRLRSDPAPEVVQWLELVQAEVGMDTEIVRMPRKPIAGQTCEAGLAMIRGSLAASR